MNGWGTTFLTIAPDGTALPCHSARDLPGLDCPNVRDHSIAEKSKDFGGCRCQAFLLTGDMHKTDPVCSKSPDRHLVDAVIASARSVAQAESEEKPLIFRNSRNSKLFGAKDP